MRIAQVAPLTESVPPRRYGGTERVVSYLTERLVELGHDVTLFASGDSQTAARLIAPSATSLRNDTHSRDCTPYTTLLMEMVFARAAAFDVVHFHMDHVHYPLARRCRTPTVTTLHGRLDLPDLPVVYGEFSEMPVISISDSQRDPLPWLNWAGTVYHGLPRHLFRFADRPGDYLAFLGRISPEKRLDRAIEIAGRCGLRLRVGAKIDRADRAYFDAVIAPLIRLPWVEFIGEVDEAEKRDLLAGASALLMPIDWPEPFGLVMIEAMASGTPVIAYRQGSVPEIVENGVTGFIVEDVRGAVSAVERIRTIERARCRAEFERRFTVERMADDYLRIYRRLGMGHAGPRRDIRAGAGGRGHPGR